MKKYKISAPYTKKFTDFLLNIQELFSKNSTTIHKARNELKILHCEHLDLVVKSFKVPHLLNRIIYSFFRDTKAKKSYENSLKIIEFVPKPVGYIEFYDFWLLKESYFVSEKFDFDFTIREPLTDSSFAARESVFKAFAAFTLQLHDNGIFHNDFSPGNILIQQKADTYIFKIVDINRMLFKQLTLDERLKNFSKLWALDADLDIIIKEYARLSNLDEQYCLKQATHYNKKHKRKINAKKRMKGIEIVD